MTRTTWRAVTAVVVLLLASSGVSHSAWRTWSAWPARVIAQISALDWESVLPTAWTARDAWLAHLPWVWIVNGLVVAVGVAIAVHVLRPARGNPRRTVRRLARSGGTLPVIARRARLSQDAVRTLLTETERRRVSTAVVHDFTPVEATPSAAHLPAPDREPRGRKILPFGNPRRKEETDERPELVEGLSLVR